MRISDWSSDVCSSDLRWCGSTSRGATPAPDSPGRISDSLCLLPLARRGGGSQAGAIMNGHLGTAMKPLYLLAAATLAFAPAAHAEGIGAEANYGRSHGLWGPETGAGNATDLGGIQLAPGR